MGVEGWNVREEGGENAHVVDCAVVLSTISAIWTAH
jgi:hypothetical protein